MFALTALALPLLFKETRKSQDGRPSSFAAVAPGGDNIAAALNPAASSTTEEPVPADRAPLDPAIIGAVNTTPIVIAVPTSPPEGQLSVTGKAGYQTWRSGTLFSRPCAFPKAAEATKLTIRNLDNGKTTSCTVVSNATPAGGMALIVDTSVFTEIADLLEAPVPVQITWNP